MLAGGLLALPSAQAACEACAFPPFFCTMIFALAGLRQPLACKPSPSRIVHALLSCDI